VSSKETNSIGSSSFVVTIFPVTSQPIIATRSPACFPMSAPRTSRTPSSRSRWMAAR